MHIIGDFMQKNIKIKPAKGFKTITKCLEFFALNNEGTVEQVAKYINRDYTTALRIIKKLLPRYIQLERIESPVRKGRETKVYRITLHGLFCWMAVNKKVAEEKFEKIIEAHKERLLTFKKWEYFKDKGLADYIKNKFFQSILHYQIFTMGFFPAAYTLIYGRPMIPLANEKGVANAADFDILQLNRLMFPPNYVKRNFKNEWKNLISLYKAIEEDYELKRFKDMIIFERERELNEQLKAIQDWKQLLSQL